MAKPIDMVLFCPKCGYQHIDAPTPTWANPPHRSHLCDWCGHVWRPADVETNGVVTTRTRGSRDVHPPIRQQALIDGVAAFNPADFDG